MLTPISENLHHEVKKHITSSEPAQELIWQALQKIEVMVKQDEWNLDLKEFFEKIRETWFNEWTRLNGLRTLLPPTKKEPTPNAN